MSKTDLSPLAPFWAPLVDRERAFAIVVLVSLVLTLQGALVLALAPPTDADAYEYAGLARTFLETGRFDQLMLPAPGYLSPIRDVPQPAFDRLTVWTLLMIPLQAVLGDTPWVFLIPGLISYFLLGPLFYLFARGLFERRVALLASLAVMLLPRVVRIAFFEDAGQPDFLFFDLVLISTALVLRRRWAFAGLAAGLMMATRSTGIVALAVVFAWFALFDRREFLRPGLWIHFAIAGLFVVPFVLRIGSMADSFSGTVPASSILTADADTMERVQRLGFLSALDYRREPSPDSQRSKPPFERRKELVLRNARVLSLGFHSGVSWYPGLFEVITLTLLPFSILGVWACRKDRYRLFVVLTAALFPAAFLLRVHYEDRYLFPSAAMAVLLAFHGAAICGRRLKTVTPGRLFLVFVILEAAPTYAINLLSVTGPEAGRDFDDLARVGAWVRKNTEPDALMLTAPFWSPHYLMHRKTALLPLGGLETLRDAAENYRADYMLFEWHWPGDQPPRLPFLTPLLRGDRQALYSIDRTHPAFRDPRRWIPHLADFDWVGYFMKDRITFQVDKPFHKSLGIVAGGPFLGLWIFAAIWSAGLLVPIRLHGRVWLVLLLPILVAVFAVQLTALIRTVGPMSAPSPHFSVTQAKRFLASATPPDSVRAVRFADSMPREAESWKRDWDAVGLGVLPMPYREAQPPEPGVAVFARVMDDEPLVNAAFDPDRSFRAEKERTQRLEAAASSLTDAGFRVEVFDAGVLGLP